MSRKMLQQPIFFAVVLLPWLASCASTSTTQLPLNPANESEATIHILRERVSPFLYGLEVLVDGKKAAVLANASQVAFSVPTGEHRLLLQWPSGTLEKDTLEAVMTLKGRETHYFLVHKDALRSAHSSDSAPAIFVAVWYSKFHVMKLMELRPEEGEALMQKLSAQ